MIKKWLYNLLKDCCYELLTIFQDLSNPRKK